MVEEVNQRHNQLQIKFNIHKGFCWYYQSLLESGLMNAFGDLTSKFPDYQVVATGAHLFAIAKQRLQRKLVSHNGAGRPLARRSAGLDLCFPRGRVGLRGA